MSSYIAQERLFNNSSGRWTCNPKTQRQAKSKAKQSKNYIQNKQQIHAIGSRRATSEPSGLEACLFKANSRRCALLLRSLRSLTSNRESASYALRSDFASGRHLSGNKGNHYLKAPP